MLTVVAPAGTWPLPPLLALLLMAAVSRDRARWFDPGRTNRRDWAATAAISLAAPAALVTWLLTVGTPSAGVLAAAERLRSKPTWLLPLIGLDFAVFNAFAEEAMYRGLLESALARTVGSWPAVFCQGAVFGLAHVGGFPSGVAGVVLAGFYGVALGILRQRSGGLLAPWAAHVVADLAISSMVVIYVL